MANELDVSWFDLSKYDELASMDLSGWHNQLEVRNLITYFIEEKYTHPELREYDYLDFFERIKENPIWRHEKEGSHSDKIPFIEAKKYPFNSYAVQNTVASDIWFFASEDRFKNVWDSCEKYFMENIELDDDIMDLINTPVNFLYSGYSDNSANLTIDLTASNEQIIIDFQHWLTEYRKFTGLKSIKNNFTNKDLANWHELSLLPYIDLTIHAAIEGKKITDSAMAELINQDIDRLRKTIKPKSRQLLRHETLAAIEAQLSSFPKK